LYFFLNHTATTEIYTLSLHDALPIFDVEVAARRKIETDADQALAEQEAVRLLARRQRRHIGERAGGAVVGAKQRVEPLRGVEHRSEEHTSELQSRRELVCRLLLEKKK